MVTKEQALTASIFHDETRCVKNGCDFLGRSAMWRRNGATKTWVKDSKRFRVPIKFGLRSDYDCITESNAHLFHTSENCPNKG